SVVLVSALSMWRRYLRGVFAGEKVRATSAQTRRLCNFARLFGRGISCENAREARIFPHYITEI
ncbi:MAG TPA: hypothetical protein PK971_00965, partial [Saprospiraceae bacterium]|nr:hypothetical protein [Saprospiraceae bacterium]